MTSPWMAPQNPFQREVESFENPMFPESFKGILGTCRSEAAGRRRERRDAHLIEPYQQHERENDDLADDHQYFVILLSHCLWLSSG